jgi:hypothetical protein
MVVSGSGQKLPSHTVQQLDLYLVVAQGWAAAGQLEKAEVRGMTVFASLLQEIAWGLTRSSW